MKLCVFALLFLALSTGALPAEKTASQLYKEAQRAERAGDNTTAYLLYSEAAAKNPSNRQYQAHAEAMRLLAGKSTPRVAAGNAAPDPTPALDPSILGSITEQDVAESRKLLPPPEVKGTPGNKDFNLKGDSKELFEQLAKAFDLKAVFDLGYQPKTGLRLQLTDSDFRDAIRAMEAASDSFVIPLTSRQFLVANDTTQKRAELDRTATVIIPAPEPFAIQEIQEIATGVRGTLDIQRLMVDSQRRLILIRDRVSKVRMAQKLVQDLMHARPQVAVEIELIETDQSSSLSYGLSLPTAFSLVWFGTASNLHTTPPSGFTNYLGFGGGKSFLGLGVTNASLFANVSKSSSRTLLKSEVFTSDGAAASLHVGDKYPIVTNQYLGTSTGTGQVYTPPPTFNFEDLGLLLKITPHVHGTDDMTLDVESEFKLLGSTSVDGIPVISNRKFQSKVRVATGEWAVLAGLMTDSDGKTITGIPGLSFIPLLRSNKYTHDHGETLVILKPHLLNLPPTESVTMPAWVGTETRPRSAL